MAQHNIIGKEGEAFAVEFLKNKGHEILACNYRFEKAEIDIISKHQNLIIFTEVKTRSSSNFGFPEESITKKKQQLVSNAALHFMEGNNLKNEIRFDVISLTKSKTSYDVFYIEDAFFSFVLVLEITH